MNGVWIVGYLANEGNDGNHLYTKIDVFQNREDMESKLMKNGWSLEEINNCIDKDYSDFENSWTADIWFQSFSK